MKPQVFIDKQRVQHGRVKASKEHAHHNQQVNIQALHTQCKVMVVVLKGIVVDAEIGFEQGVIVGNGCVQEFLSAAVHGVNIEAFVLNIADGVLLLIGGKGEDGGNFQRFGNAFLQILKRFIIQLAASTLLTANMALKPLAPT